MSSWGGRKVRRLLLLVLAHKGTVCHLCGLDGANSPDHDPPRSVLLARGVLDPDQLEYLWPSHRGCNILRNSRPINDELRNECKAARLAALGLDQLYDTLSPRFAAHRPQFFESMTISAEGSLPPISPEPPTKTAQRKAST